MSKNQIHSFSTMWIEAGKSFCITPNLVDRYLWKVESRFCNKKDCLNCPLNSTCKTKLDIKEY